MEEIPEIELDRAKGLLDSGGATFVDVRDPGSFAEAHIPGAKNILDDAVEEFVSSGDKERPLIVYCYHGNSSLGGAAYFLDRGFREVYSLTGGFESWRTHYPPISD